MPNNICAIATAPGGAIGIIRVSGPEAISITDKIFTPKGDKPLSERKSHTLAFGTIHDAQGEAIDEVVVSLYRAPHSYTGEDSTEISCHSSSYILNTIMHLLIEEGCRLANPGEYTQRAFLAGKLDLSQAEAVADLIASDSAATHRLALNQMRGGFSQELRTLRDQLLHIASLMELELDFSDHEELEFADRSQLSTLVDKLDERITSLIRSFQVGNAIKHGIPVAIVGDTNVGKSTLLNALLHEDRAIVSSIQGTTRDVIEDTINLHGITFRFIDTAGIRATHDEVEQMGISRTYEKMEQATLLLWMVDATRPKQPDETFRRLLAEKNSQRSTLLLFNKCDEVDEATLQELRTTYSTYSLDTLTLSAKRSIHIVELEAWLTTHASLPEVNQDSLIVTNLRHQEALKEAHSALQRVRKALTSGIPTDLVTEDLRDCIYHLSDIAGEVTSADVLQNIFSHFCIGK